MGSTAAAVDHGHGHGHDAHGHHDHDTHGSHYIERDEITRRVLFIMNGFDKVDKTKVSPTASFKEMGLDSLDTVEAILSIEEEFMITMDDQTASELLNLKEVIDGTFALFIFEFLLISCSHDCVTTFVLFIFFKPYSLSGS
jgi:acyl carrier protein